MFAPVDRHEVWSQAVLACAAPVPLQALTVRPVTPLVSPACRQAAGEAPLWQLFHAIAFPYPPHSFCSVMASYCSFAMDFRLPTSPQAHLLTMLPCVEPAEHEGAMMAPQPDLTSDPAPSQVLNSLEEGPHTHQRGIISFLKTCYGPATLRLGIITLPYR